MTALTPIRYDIHRPAFAYHYDITGHDNKQNLYYCNVIRFTKSTTPDLVLHAGLDKSAPSVALSHILQFSQSFKIGLGSVGDMDNVEWEDFRRSNVSGSEHRWGMNLPNNDKSLSDRTASDDRLSLVWKRTTAVTTEGGSTPITNHRGHRGHRGWKLVEESNPDEILAIFTFDKVFGRRGILQIDVNYGEKFNVGVLISILTLYERSEER